MTGLEKVRHAICKAAGWDWCDEHCRARYHGEYSCDLLHPVVIERVPDYSPNLHTVDIEEIRKMTHEEKIEMLHQMVKDSELATEHLKELLTWFISKREGLKQ